VVYDYNKLDINSVMVSMVIGQIVMSRRLLQTLKFDKFSL